MKDLNNTRLIDITLGEFFEALDSRYNKQPGSINTNKDAAPIKVKECAEITGYVEDYIRQLVHKNKIPYTKVNNGGLRFDKPTIIKWMNNNKRIPIEEAAQGYIENVTFPLSKKIFNA